MGAGAGPARAAPISFDLGAPPEAPVVSDGLEFSNFDFESIFGDVEAEDVLVTIDGTSVTLSGSAGPLAVSDGDRALFRVSYDVAASLFPIEGVSLFLDSQTEADDRFAAVIAKKLILGDDGHGDCDDDRHGHHGRHGEEERHGDKGRHGGDDDHRSGGKQHGGKGHGERDRDGEHDEDDLGRLLAKLSTFDVSKRESSRERRFDEEQFEPQARITVVDSVFLTALGEDDEAALNSLRNEFAVVPEPAPVALLGLGLLGLAYLGRRR